MKVNEILSEEQELAHNIFSVGQVYAELGNKLVLWKAEEIRLLMELTDTGEWRMRSKADRKDYCLMYAMYSGS